MCHHCRTSHRWRIQGFSKTFVFVYLALPHRLNYSQARYAAPEDLLQNILLLHADSVCVSMSWTSSRRHFVVFSSTVHFKFTVKPIVLSAYMFLSYFAFISFKFQYSRLNIDSIALYTVRLNVPNLLLWSLFFSPSECWFEYVRQENKRRKQVEAGGHFAVLIRLNWHWSLEFFFNCFYGWIFIYFLFVIVSLGCVVFKEALYKKAKVKDGHMNVKRWRERKRTPTSKMETQFSKPKRNRESEVERTMKALASS